MEQNIYIMEFWKLKKNRKRIVFCVIFCSIITFLIFTLACKIIGADVMEACVPVHNEDNSEQFLSRNNY